MKQMIQELLKQELKKRQQKNPQYSLRSFARDLKISPSMISRFLSGEREPSPESLGQILDCLEVDESLKKQILDSLLSKRDFNIPKDSDYVELDAKQLAVLNHWLFFALLELLRSSNRKFSIEKISKTMGQPVKNVEEKINILLELGLIKRTQSGFKTMSVRQTSKNSRAVLDQIHSGYLDQAKISMISCRDQERSISGTTILVSPDRLAEAYERVKLFRRSLSSYLQVKLDEKEEKLYRLQIALFPLEKD